MAYEIAWTQTDDTARQKAATRPAPGLQVRTHPSAVVFRALETLASCGRARVTLGELVDVSELSPDRVRYALYVLVDAGRVRRLPGRDPTDREAIRYALR